MKKFLTLLLVNVFFIGAAMAQSCQPDPIYADSSAGVYPRPLTDENPDGGITESACINQPYFFNFTIVVSETIDIAGGTFELDSIVISEVSGLPEGLGIPSAPFVICNPATCTFPSGTQGCAAITGTATADNAAGDYDLVISGTVYTVGLPPIPVEFPGPLFPGEYILTLEEENAGTCFVGTENFLEEQVGFKAVPNPTTGSTLIEITSQIDSRMQFTVTDMVGKVIRQEMVNINEGDNQLQLNAGDLMSGIYIYSLSNELGSISKKLVVSK